MAPSRRSFHSSNSWDNILRNCRLFCRAFCLNIALCFLFIAPVSIWSDSVRQSNWIGQAPQTFNSGVNRHETGGRGLTVCGGVGWYLVGGCVAECVIVAVVFVFVFVFCFCCCCDDVMSPLLVNVFLSACVCVKCKLEWQHVCICCFSISTITSPLGFCCCSRWIIWALPLSLAPFPMQILIRAAKVNVLSLLFLFLFLFSCQQVSYWTTFTLPTWRKSCHPPPLLTMSFGAPFYCLLCWVIDNGLSHTRRIKHNGT